MFPVIAVVAALGGAIAFAVSSVIEQHVTHEVTERRALDPRLLLDLVREPAWVGSIGLNIAGLALQITALHFGPWMRLRPRGEHRAAVAHARQARATSRAGPLTQPFGCHNMATVRLLFCGGCHGVS